MNLSLHPANFVRSPWSTVIGAALALAVSLASTFAGLPAPWPVIGYVVSVVAFIVGALVGQPEPFPGAPPVVPPLVTPPPKGFIALRLMAAVGFVALTLVGCNATIPIVGLSTGAVSGSPPNCVRPVTVSYQSPASTDSCTIQVPVAPVATPAGTVCQ